MQGALCVEVETLGTVTRRSRMVGVKGRVQVGGAELTEHSLLVPALPEVGPSLPLPLLRL